MHATVLPAVGKPVLPIVAHPATHAAACASVDVDVDLLKRLAAIGPEWLIVSMKGRLLIRNVCMVFDRDLATRSEGPRHSPTV